MQVKYYKGVSAPQHPKSGDGARVRVPGYVSTSSWTGAGDLNEPAPANRKGRVLTPPPSAAMGLHQLTLEAFWLD